MYNEYKCKYKLWNTNISQNYKIWIYKSIDTSIIVKYKCKYKLWNICKYKHKLNTNVNVFFNS